MSMLDKIPEIIIGPSSRLDGRKIAWILCHAPEDAQGMYCTLGYLYYDDEMMWWGSGFFGRLFSRTGFRKCSWGASGWTSRNPNSSDVGSTWRLMTIDYSQYPADWKEISRDLRFRRAGNRCETRGAESDRPRPVTGSREAGEI